MFCEYNLSTNFFVQYIFTLGLHKPYTGEKNPRNPKQKKNENRRGGTRPKNTHSPNQNKPTTPQPKKQKQIKTKVKHM